MRNTAKQKAHNWKQLQRVALERLHNGADTASVAKELDISPKTIWKWLTKLKNGEKIHQRPGRPTFDERKIKAALMEVLEGSFGSLPVRENPLYMDTPYLARIPRSLVQKRLAKLGIHKSPNAISYWLKRLGWHDSFLPEEFVAGYKVYVGQLPSDDIEEIARNRRRITAHTVLSASNDREINVFFSLTAVRWECEDPEELRSIPDSIRSRLEFMSEPYPEDPWEGEELTPEDISDMRVYLIAHANEDCPRLFADRFMQVDLDARKRNVDTPQTA